MGSDERYLDLPDDMTPLEVFCNITLIVEHGFVLLKATMKYTTKHDVFDVSETQISLINSYGHQPFRNCNAEIIPILPL